MISLQRLIDEAETEHNFADDHEYGVAWCNLNGLDPTEVEDVLAIATLGLDVRTLAMTVFWLGWEARGEREQEVWGL